MATRSPERRQHTDRRRSGDRASDLYQRLEEKRQQIERRRKVRREADRRAREPEPSSPEPTSDDGRPAAPSSVADEHSNSVK